MPPSQCWLLCNNCEAFLPDNWAHPELGDRHGSLIVCADGHETYAGTWRDCFRPRTEQQQIEDAHAAGRLF